MPQTVFQAEHFINRELSWLEFNARVLEEAEDPSNPLLERLKFLAIFSSNLDEFFMVRVAGLREQAFGDGAPQDYSPDGLRPGAQLQRLRLRTKELITAQYRCWNEQIQPQLQANGIEILKHEQLDTAQRAALDRFFHDRAFPILTPMAIDPSHPTPHFHNRQLYLGAVLRRETGLGPRQLFAVVQLPQILPRFVPIGQGDRQQFILLEQAVAARLPELFGGFSVLHWSTFRISRDSDIEMLEQESDDMLRLIEERLKTRQRGEAVRLEVPIGADPSLVWPIIEEESLRLPDDPSSDAYSEVYWIPGPLDLTALMEIAQAPSRDFLRAPSFSPQPPRGVRGRGEDLYAAISRRDILLHHPYDSFDPVVEFVASAAKDPKVLAIKQTLYRTSGDSPIVRALIQAAESGKHVTALVELKARFDEERNVSWARQLERAGVHVVFGFLDLKTHCKVSLVVRQEGSILKRYVHLGTGNYNSHTALLYTDLGLFTSNDDITEDASALFNLLTGYSQGHAWRKLVVAPEHLQNVTLELINAQAERARAGQKSWIFAKLNALVDYRIIEALYHASQAGVPIDLVVRGICGLRPGLPGISETIRVRSIVDRFLEHSRIFVFGPAEECRVFMSSADWMPRNFHRRVEVMAPIDAPELKHRILNEIVPLYLRDNQRARLLRSDGGYSRAERLEGEAPHRCQEEFLALRPAFSPLPERTSALGGGHSSANGSSAPQNAADGENAGLQSASTG
jgi:polyphosphate kinase